MRLIDRLRSPAGEKRYSLEDWYSDQSQMLYGGHNYPLGLTYSMQGDPVEAPTHDYAGYARIYKANGPVFACSAQRMRLFTQALFQWQQLRGGRPGDLFGNRDLSILERPWPNGTTGELLGRAEQCVTLGGNFYVARERNRGGDRLRWLRPDCVTILLTAPPDEAVASDVAGYAYHPGKYTADKPLEVYTVDELAHWSPIPDPEAQYRGMSWVTPVVREVMGDQAATRHKQKFFDNAATPNLAISPKESFTPEQFRKLMEVTEERHGGVENAYKTLYLGFGADVTVVGRDMRQMDFKLTQGAGETRIAAAAGVPPIVAGLSEGLQNATYSNYGQARRAFGDIFAYPQWQDFCGALEVIVPPPQASRLAVATDHIAYLREDQTDRAEVAQKKAVTIRQLVDAGYTPDSVIAAVEAEDFTLLKHSGLYSVQLQPPGTAAAPATEAPAPSMNGATP